MQRDGCRIFATSLRLFLALLLVSPVERSGSAATPPGDEDTVDVDALLADDALLDALLFGDDADAPLPLTTEAPKGEAQSDLGRGTQPNDAPSMEPSQPAPSRAEANPSGFDDEKTLWSSKATIETLLEEDEETLSLWDWEHQVTLGGGYKKNALFSAFAQEDSAFLLSEWETTVLRLGGPRDWQILGFGVVENRHYFDVDGLDNEWLALVMAKVDKAFGKSTIGLTAQYMYFEQAFSLAFEELDLGATEVALNQFKIVPRWRYRWSDKLYSEVRVPLALNLFEDETQDYDEVGIVGELGWVFDRGGRAWMSYGYERQSFDERTERTQEGDPIEGALLDWQEHVLELGLDLPLDDAEQWWSKSRFRHRLVEDGGSGYYDFAQTKFSQGIKYERGPWELDLDASYTHYDYRVQTEESDENDRRHRALLALTGEVSRTFGGGESWDGFFRYTFESYLSNDPEDVYDVHVFTLGARYRF